MAPSVASSAAGAGAQVRLAVDIGGTFTDLVAVDAATGDVVRAKADTTPNLTDGVLTALERSSVPGASIGAFIHGTTVVINAVTERRGAPTALVTTRGFRDVLEIGRANRPDLYNLAYAKPPPYVPRRLRFEIAERMTHLGAVAQPLSDDDVGALAARIAACDVRAVAVCLLHSWANPRHEQHLAAALRVRLPSVAVVASHEISGQWREYERTSTAVLSAYVQPVVAGYLASLEAALRGQGVAAPLRAMRSSGGVSSFARAAQAPIALLESGPVAGVMAAAELGRRLGNASVLTLDIGGTTAKTSAVRDGEVRIDTLHHIGKTPTSAGYPVQVPTVEIIEIGAGGGSVVWSDQAGGLHVGPRSAGADPGPACYGRGGAEPTLTDANLLLGRLDPDYFLGGTRTLDAGAAEKALAALGGSIGTDARAAARGALRYAVAQMSHALRLVTLRRGHDPRDFGFVAYGGAGPLHAALLARELGISRTVIPPGPGHFSAFGMLASPLRGEAVRTVVGPLEHIDLTAAFAGVEAAALAELGGRAAKVARYAELRYAGQEHTLEVPVPDPPVLSSSALDDIRAAFERRCLDSYSFRLDAPLEVVALRASATEPAAPISWSDHTDTGSRPAARNRVVDLDPYGPAQDVPVLVRAELASRVAGPCVIEEPAATTLVLPGQRARQDADGNLILEES
ncbi:MAG TPA: hydantoinase/oxoprolinase family protein [Streptosporangiaceae bacterium]|nr:hydantoinase/oxoprolinase family protein [Streptosporangiaceae bacterium]